MPETYEAPPAADVREAQKRTQAIRDRLVAEEQRLAVRVADYVAQHEGRMLHHSEHHIRDLLESYRRASEMRHHADAALNALRPLEPEAE